MTDPTKGWKVEVTLTQQQSGWQNDFEVAKINFKMNSTITAATIPNGTITIEYTAGTSTDAGKLTIAGVEGVAKWNVTEVSGS